MTDNKKNIFLECIRGLAALAVFICHLFANVTELEKRKNHLTSFFSNWGSEAVFIFFILSGIVIHISFENKPRAASDFLKNRILRLHPVLFFALIFSLPIEHFIFKNQFSIVQFIANLIPISTISLGEMRTYQSNPVIWSLCYEVCFYLFFATICIRKKQIDHKMIWIWFIISLTGIYILSSGTILNRVNSFLVRSIAFSSIWIVGFFIWKFRNICYTNRHLGIFSLCALPLISRLHIISDDYNSLKYFIFAVVSCPFFLYIINHQKINSAANKYLVYAVIIIYVLAATLMWLDAKYLLIVKCLYIAFPIIAVALSSNFRNWINFALKKATPLSVYLGKISYSFYIVHFPIIIFVNSLAIPLLVKLTLIISIIGFSTYMLEFVLQPYINKKLK